ARAKWLPSPVGPIKLSTGCTVAPAKPVGDELQLKLSDGSERRVHHVRLGTGYDVNISRYDFLSSDLADKVQSLDGHPDLSAGFASSVSGWHFIGAPAARNYGPLLYFVPGTEFTSKHLTAHISRNRTMAA